MLYNYIRRGAV